MVLKLVCLPTKRSTSCKPVLHTLHSSVPTQHQLNSNKGVFIMKIVTFTLVVIAVFFSTGIVSAQTMNPASVNSANSANTPTVYQLVGEVMAVDKTANQVSIKIKGNEVVALSLDQNTDYKRVPPGETTLNKADRKSTRLNSSHVSESRMPSS